MALVSSVRLILPLTTSSVDVSLGASHTSRPALERNRVTPFVHSPLATRLQILGQVRAAGSILIEPAVLLAPLGNIAALPLSTTALGHGTDAHTRHQNVEAVLSDIATVIDDLVEQRVDFAALGAGSFSQLEHITGTFAVLFRGAAHSSKCVSNRRVDLISPWLLTATLELFASTAA